MNDGKMVEGEHNITNYKDGIKDIYYKISPKINPEVIKAIKESDMIILSMGSLYTSIICNLLSLEVKNAIDNSKAKILYVCNMFTQPGETDNFTVSKHIKVINDHLGNRKINTVIINEGKIPKKYILKYHREEEKTPVLIDKENISKLNVKIIKDNFVKLEDNSLKHDAVKLSLKIFEELIKH